MSSDIEPVSALSRASWIKGASVVAGVVIYQSLAHWLLSVDPYGALSEIFLALPLLLLAGWILTLFNPARVVLFLSIPVGGAALLLSRKSGVNAAWLYPVPNITINLFLLWLFGRTLRRGQTALITRIASLVHGPLTDEMSRYTRRATWAWCVFFAAMIVLSIVLYAFCSLETWSLFANMMSFPLVALMFVGEYAWRKLRHPDFNPSTLLSGVHAFRRLRELPDRPDRRGN
ncbi:MAG TPA: hypothetical protein VHB46_18210 [Burkholderiales bacterium]|nr:hypothetical protein [Burkholderiales bacterium]